jgi:hypothetical protein
VASAVKSPKVPASRPVPVPVPEPVPAPMPVVLTPASVLDQLSVPELLPRASAEPTVLVPTVLASIVLVLTVLAPVMLAPTVLPVAELSVVERPLVLELGLAPVLGEAPSMGFVMCLLGLGTPFRLWGMGLGCGLCMSTAMTSAPLLRPASTLGGPGRFGWLGLLTRLLSRRVGSFGIVLWSCRLAVPSSPIC